MLAPLKTQRHRRTIQRLAKHFNWCNIIYITTSSLRNSNFLNLKNTFCEKFNLSETSAELYFASNTIEVEKGTGKRLLHFQDCHHRNRLAVDPFLLSTHAKSRFLPQITPSLSFKNVTFLAFNRAKTVTC